MVRGAHPASSEPPPTSRLARVLRGASLHSGDGAKPHPHLKPCSRASGAQRGAGPRTRTTRSGPRRLLATCRVLYMSPKKAIGCQVSPECVCRGVGRDPPGNWVSTHSEHWTSRRVRGTEGRHGSLSATTASPSSPQPPRRRRSPSRAWPWVSCPPFSNTRKQPLRLPGHWGPGLPPPPEARAVRGARPHRPPLRQPLPGSGAGAAGRALTGRFSLMASTGW